MGDCATESRYECARGSFWSACARRASSAWPSPADFAMTLAAGYADALLH